MTWYMSVSQLGLLMCDTCTQLPHATVWVNTSYSYTRRKGDPSISTDLLLIGTVILPQFYLTWGLETAKSSVELVVF